MNRVSNSINVLLIFSGFLSFTIAGCDSNLFGDCPPDSFKGQCVSGIVFDIYNKDSTVNLFQIGVNRYDRNSVRLYDERGQEPSYALGQDGSFHFSMELDEYPSNIRIAKRYFLKLNNDDTDTLDFVFIPDYKCEDYFELSIFEASYNGVKQFEKENTCGPRFKLYKDIY